MEQTLKKMGFFFRCFSYKHSFCCLSTSAVLACTRNYGIKGCPKPPFQSLLNPQGVKFLLRWLIQTTKYLQRAQKKVWNSVMDVLNCSRMTSPAPAPLLRDNPHAKHLLNPMENENLSVEQGGKTAVCLSCLWILSTSSFQGFSSQQPAVPTFRTLIYMIF